MKVYKILLPININEPFDYISDDVLARGEIVMVTFRGKPKLGVVWGQGESAVEDYKLKRVDERLGMPLLDGKLLKFIEWVAKYNMAGIGNVLRMCLAVEFGGRRVEAKEQVVKYIPPQLTDAQSDAAKVLRQQVADKKFHVTLLDGVTGSGKTEVYFEAIDEALEAGKQVLVLLPEIALSVQWVSRFKERFGIEPYMWNSQRTPAQRRETWLDVLQGKAKLVVGARSALFLPYNNLALIVVDEEHDQSFKQDEGTHYHGRDMAVVRAKIESVPIVLVTATPSVETMYNVEEGKYECLKLPERFGGAGMPDVELVDMRAEYLKSGYFLSTKVREQITAAFERGVQSALFLNRRGYAPLTLCRKCGHRIQCPNCSAWMVQHLKSYNLQCHHCGINSPIPSDCPECHETGQLHACGPGVERLLEEVKELFPDAHAEILSSDGDVNVEDVIARVMSGEVDILIGTQMIAKGHHFPNLEFVGIIDADLGLEGGDLRAMERTYQILHQVAGRAGREEQLGTVLVQTYMPENSALKALINHDRDAFLTNEMQQRKQHKMPPYYRLATVTLSGKLEKVVREKMEDLARIAPNSPDIDVLGPAPAQMSYLRNQYRYRLIVRMPSKMSIQHYLDAWLKPIKLPSSLTLRVDIDPYNFM